MQIIPENLITVISADSEDAEFPATNMLLAHSRETWIADTGVYSALVTLATIGAAANGLFFWYLLGDSATITIYDDVSLGGSIIYGPAAVDLAITDSYYTNDVQIPGVWVEYTNPGTAHSAKIEITRSGAEPEIGMAWAGKRWEISQNPLYGLGRDYKDHAIAFDLGNGYEYLYGRNVQKVWPLSLELRGNPPTEFFTFLEMMERIAPNPVPVLLADNATPQYRYLIYGRVINVKPTQAKHNKSTISFTLKEYL